MSTPRMNKLFLQEAYCMWLPILKKCCGNYLNDREYTIASSCFSTGWEARGVHESREAKDVQPIFWCIVDKNGKAVSWKTPTCVNPSKSSCAANELDNVNQCDPETAPHSWQPLIVKEAK